MLAADDMKRKYGISLHFIENAGIRLYNNIVATSEVFGEKIRKINKNCKVYVIANGIEQMHVKLHDVKRQVLHLGRIEVNQKGLDLLLAAFKKFNNGNSGDYKLILAGPSNRKELETLNSLIDKLGMRNYVEIRGFVSGGAKQELLVSSACIVVSSRFETFSMVALEALALGVPLVCFDLEGLKWIPDNVAQKVPYFDVDRLSLAISNAVKFGSGIKDMVESGKKFSSKYTWESIERKYADVLERVAVNG